MAGGPDVGGCTDNGKPEKKNVRNGRNNIAEDGETASRGLLFGRKQMGGRKRAVEEHATNGNSHLFVAKNVEERRGGMAVGGLVKAAKHNVWRMRSRNIGNSKTKNVQYLYSGRHRFLQLLLTVLGSGR